LAKVLWVADGGCTTGFARVTHAIGDRLVERGHDVHVLATNYKGDPFDTKVQLYVPTLNVGTDLYGQSRFLELMDRLKPDVVVMLNDAQVLLRLLLQNRYDQQQLFFRHRPILAYIPVDGHNHPAPWKVLGDITTRVAMSKFGQSFMPEAKLVYHGVDAENFWPVSSQHPITTSMGVVCSSKADCKKAIGLPDTFIVGRVDRNGGRKDYASTWKSLVPVMKKHSDIAVYFHCRGKDERSGTDLPSLWSRDEETLPRFFMPGNFDNTQGYSIQDLNAVYNAMDLFVTNSRGEGFGLTIAEALACEVPVIAQNVSAIPEVVGPGGDLIEPDREITVPFGQDQWLSDIPAFSAAIEHAYLSSGWRREKGKAGRKHVLETFRWEDAAESFHESITVLAESPEEEHAPPTDSGVAVAAGPG